MAEKRPWHPYVFDTEKRAFVGDFEGMYRAGVDGNFDPWFQTDPRRIEHRLAAVLLEQISFSSVIDLGCGTGYFTAQMKRRDNQVVGVDISETAIETARERFPDVEFAVSEIGEYLAKADPVDLVVIRGTLVYLEDWREVLCRCAEVGRYTLLDSYVPAGTIGFIGSHAELGEELERHFEVLEHIVLPRREVEAHLCRSRYREEE